MSMTPTILPPPITPADIRRKPSLRWRLRHRLKIWLFGNPPEPWTPKTEWGRMRRAERIQLSREAARLRSFRARVTAACEGLDEGDRARIARNDGEPVYMVMRQILQIVEGA